MTTCHGIKKKSNIALGRLIFFNIKWLDSFQADSQSTVWEQAVRKEFPIISPLDNKSETKTLWAGLSVLTSY